MGAGVVLLLLVLVVLNVEIGKYEKWLSGSKEHLSVFAVTANKEDLNAVFQYNQSFPHVIATTGIADPNYLAEHHPELLYESIPVYFVFDEKDLLYTSYVQEDLYRFLEEWKP